MIEKDYYNGWNDEGNLGKILPCPFCGGNGELLDDGYEHPVIDENGAYVDMDIFEGDTFWIECEKCGAMITGADTPEKAIEEWNKRTESKWIQLWGKMPKENQKVFVTVKYVDGDTKVDRATYIKGEFMRDKYISFGDLVIAWMPRNDPEPYNV